MDNQKTKKLVANFTPAIRAALREKGETEDQIEAKIRSVRRVMEAHKPPMFVEEITRVKKEDLLRFLGQYTDYGDYVSLKDLTNWIDENKETFKIYIRD